MNVEVTLDLTLEIEIKIENMTTVRPYTHTESNLEDNKAHMACSIAIHILQIRCTVKDQKIMCYDNKTT